MFKARFSPAIGAVFAAVAICTTLAFTATLDPATAQKRKAEKKKKRFVANPVTIPVPPTPPARHAAYPTASADIVRLQARLFEHRCYGNQLSSNDREEDGRFGPKSRRALWTFVNTLNSKLITPGRRALVPTSPDQIFAAFDLPTVGENAPYCQGSQFLPVWFTDKNEHVEGVATRGADAGKFGSCNREEVGREYLGNLARTSPELATAAGLSRPLKAMLDNFDAIFRDTPTLSFNYGMSPRALEVLNKYGKRGINRETGRQALRDAYEQLLRLSFTHGIQSKADCDICYKINDWIYLRGLAMATGGLLVITDEKGIITVTADTITERMLYSVSGNIKLHRSIAANYLQILSTRRMPEGIEMEDLLKARDDELKIIIATLFRSTDKVPNPSGNRLMRELFERYTCIGFDGGAVDQ